MNVVSTLGAAVSKTPVRVRRVFRALKPKGENNPKTEPRSRDKRGNEEEEESERRNGDGGTGGVEEGGEYDWTGGSRTQISTKASGLSVGSGVGDEGGGASSGGVGREDGRGSVVDASPPGMVNTESSMPLRMSSRITFAESVVESQETHRQSMQRQMIRKSRSNMQSGTIASTPTTSKSQLMNLHGLTVKPSTTTGRNYNKWTKGNRNSGYAKRKHTEVSRHSTET